MPLECQIFIKPLEDLNRALSRDPGFFFLMNFSSYLFVLKGRALCLPWLNFWKGEWEEREKMREKWSYENWLRKWVLGTSLRGIGRGGEGETKEKGVETEKQGQEVVYVCVCKYIAEKEAYKKEGGGLIWLT